MEKKMQSNYFEELRQVQSMFNDAKKLKQFHEKYADEISNPNIDKYGKGFNHDDRFQSFKAMVYFGAKSGAYGSSSVGSCLYLDDPKKASDALIEYLNRNEEAVIKGMSEILLCWAKDGIDKAEDKILKANEFLSEVAACNFADQD
jgi:hypothetical protein